MKQVDDVNISCTKCGNYEETGLSKLNSYIVNYPIRKKYDKRDVNNIIVDSLFGFNGTLSEIEAIKAIKWLAFKHNAVLSKTIAI